MREYTIVIGSKIFFDKYIEDNVGIHDDFLTELVKNDNCHTRGVQFDADADSLVLYNSYYHAIKEEAHYRLGSIIEELTLDDAKIYIHNPPTRLLKYLKQKNSSAEITLREEKEHYQSVADLELFSAASSALKTSIIGQESAIREVIKSLWYLANVKREKPYVVMLYGESSIGKTEIVRTLARELFDNKVIEKHLSMFRSNSYTDYFFGEKPTSTTLAYDLLERESNLLFLDELDKCPEWFFSAFYTLFDNTIFIDRSYEVDISGLVVFLTSNYHSEKEMQDQLGDPIFYRIDKFIKLDSFSVETISSVLDKYVRQRMDELPNSISINVILQEVESRIKTSNENARTIQRTIQDVIEDILLQQVDQK